MSVCDLPGIGHVCEKAGEAAASLITAPFEWLASSLGSLAAFMFEAVWEVFDTTTVVDVTSPGYRKVYALIFGIACLLMLLFFTFQLLTGLARREAGALRRAITGLAKSVLGSAAALSLIALALTITDQLCVGIVQATGHTMQSLGARIALLAGGGFVFTLAAPGAGILLGIFLASLAVTSAAIVWFSLLIRKSLLLVAIVLAPVALAGQTWDATRAWVGKWTSFVIALIVSKIVLVVILLVAVTQTASPLAPDLQSLSEPIAGVVLMMIAGFAPYMTHKLIAFMGADMYHLMSAGQEAKHAMNRPLPTMAPMRGPSGPLGTDATPISGTSSSAGSAGGGAAGASTSPATSFDASGGASASAAGVSDPATTGSIGAGSTSGAAGAGAGGAAAAGPAAVAVLGAQAVKSAATAGPRVGGAIGSAAMGTTQAAEPTQASGLKATNAGEPLSAAPAPTPTTGFAAATGPAGEAPPTAEASAANGWTPRSASAPSATAPQNTASGTSAVPPSSAPPGAAPSLPASGSSPLPAPSGSAPSVTPPLGRRRSPTTTPTRPLPTPLPAHPIV